MEKLIREAAECGIKNPSLYYFLPPTRREKALKEDIDKAKAENRKNT